MRGVALFTRMRFLGRLCAYLRGTASFGVGNGITTTPCIFRTDQRCSLMPNDKGRAVRVFLGRHTRMYPAFPHPRSAQSLPQRLRRTRAAGACVRGQILDKPEAAAEDPT